MRTLSLALIGLSSPALAVPAQFTHQGRLLSSDGTPVGGEVTIIFRIMDADTGGIALWEDSIPVLLDRGYYSAILGVDEDTNPLDTAVFSQHPLWLEIQLEGGGAMVPRSPIQSVPYATMATVAEEVAGGPVDASQVAIDGTVVISETGEWIGPTAAVNWSDIDGMPSDFADGIDNDSDTDTLADLALSCADGDIPVWDAVVANWSCDIDRDTLSLIGCEDGQLIQWSADAVGWICADDADTRLTEDEVDAMVADNGFASTDDLFSGRFADLADIPDGLLDGDDNTQLSEPEVDAMVADNGFALLSELFSGSFLDLTDVPPGLADGDDDTVLSEDEVDAMVADNGYLTAADIPASGSSGTVIYTRCAWTGEIMPTIGSCTPPECPSPFEDLGITGNVKTALAAHASTDYSPTYSESSGYQERACYLANPVTVLVTRCSWTGETAPDIDTCIPPECPTDWSDLGITGNIKSALGMYGSTDYSPPYSESSGYQERTCTLGSVAATAP